MVTATAARAAAPARVRLASIDVVRGAVMVLMAIDHVRVYSGVPAGGPSAGVFFTRWVTHFCAPVFVFLAGTSAYFLGRTLDDPRRVAQGFSPVRPRWERNGSLSRYLMTRGILLVVLELTVIRASWTFGGDYSQFILAGVIWMLGWCMVLMAGLVRLPVRAVGAFGILTMLFQDVLNALPSNPLTQLTYLGGEIPLGSGGPTVSVLYTIFPWIGVMAAGYAFGAVMAREPAERRRLCLRIGLGATALFVILAGVSVLTSTSSGNAPALVRMLNQRKYPASQLFLLMTLGPAIALMPFVEHARGWILKALEIFGRVPMFYYLLHIPLIHAVSLLAWRLRGGALDTSWFSTAPYVSVPPEHRWSLALLYLVFAVSVALLYVPCRWYAGLKARRKDVWLRYI